MAVAANARITTAASKTTLRKAHVGVDVPTKSVVPMKIVLDVNAYSRRRCNLFNVNVGPPPAAPHSTGGPVVSECVRTVEW